MSRLLEIVTDGLAARRCTICDSAEHIQDSHGGGGLNDVCLACFYIWLDGGVGCERPEHYDQRPHIHGDDILAFNLKAKAEGKWPFDGKQLPARAPVPHE